MPAAAASASGQSLVEPALFLRAVAANIQAGKKVTRAAAQSTSGEWRCILLFVCDLCCGFCGEWCSHAMRSGHRDTGRCPARARGLPTPHGRFRSLCTFRDRATHSQQLRFQVQAWAARYPAFRSRSIPSPSYPHFVSPFLQFYVPADINVIFLLILLSCGRYSFLNEFCRFGDASMKECGETGGGGAEGNVEDDNDEAAE